MSPSPWRFALADILRPDDPTNRFVEAVADLAAGHAAALGMDEHAGAIVGAEYALQLIVAASALEGSVSFRPAVYRVGSPWYRERFLTPDAVLRIQAEPGRLADIRALLEAAVECRSLLAGCDCEGAALQLLEEAERLRWMREGRVAA